MSEENIKKEILSKLNPYGFKNLEDKDNQGNSALMFACLYNVSKSLGFQKKHWDYLIINSDLKHKAMNGWNSLAFVLVFNKSAKIELDEKILNYIIDNSDGNFIYKNNRTSLFFSMKFNIYEKLQEPIKKMHDVLSEKNRQETFKQICISYKEQNLSEKDILYVLYDLEFNISPTTHKWLEEQKYDDILKMIEKRNVLWNLNQELSEENKSKNGFKI